MPVSKKQQACVNRYVKENYDRINVTLPKGKKDTVKRHAAETGESVNGFINRAIDEAIASDRKRSKEAVSMIQDDAAYKPLPEDEFESNRERRLAALQAVIDSKR